MHRAKLEVGAIVRRYEAAFLDRYGTSVSLHQAKVLKALAACRTPAMGGHLYECDHCHKRCVTLNSCRDRHCPTCRVSLAAEWADARSAELLPVPYFFATFTLPHALNPLAIENAAIVYALLFQSVSEALLRLAADPARLGAQIGFFSVLHTWGEQLQYHPHVHVVVPGGGLSPDGLRWIRARPKFLLAARILSKRFRTIFSRLLRDAFDDGKLTFRSATLERVADRSAFNDLVSSLWVRDWVVHVEPPRGTPTAVIRYLARYTHRIAISNARLVAIDDNKVTFRYKDYADSRKPKTLTLDATEFIRRFLLHVLPKGFVRIRYYGFLANRHRSDKLDLCRKLIADTLPDSAPPPPSSDHTDSVASPEAKTAKRPCPTCKTGNLCFVRELKANNSLLVTLPLTNSS